MQFAWLLGAALTVLSPALAGGQSRVVRSDKGVLKMTTTRRGTTTPYAERPSNDPLIFGNLATKDPKAVYWCCAAYPVTGPKSPAGENWTAAAFTPAANATVTKVTVAVGYESSTKNFDVLLSLNADNNGVPGKALKTWKVTFPGGKPIFGTCCTVKSGTGSISVSANTKYWVMLSTEADSDIWAGWNSNDSDQIDQIPYAQYSNGAWTTYPNLGPAFAVYGQ